MFPAKAGWKLLFFLLDFNICLTWLTIRRQPVCKNQSSTSTHSQLSAIKYLECSDHWKNFDKISWWTKTWTCCVYSIVVWLHTDYIFCLLRSVRFVVVGQHGGSSLVNRWKLNVYPVETIEFPGVNSLVSCEHQLVIQLRLFRYLRRQISYPGREISYPVETD